MNNYILAHDNVATDANAIKSVGCFKSHCAEIWAYCLAPGHSIRKTFQKSRLFEDYTMFCNINVNFFEMNVNLSRFFAPLAVPESLPLGLLATFVWSIKIQDA